MISLKKQTDPNEHEQLISFIFNDSMTFTALKAHFVEIPHSHLTPTPLTIALLLFLVAAAPVGFRLARGRCGRFTERHIASHAPLHQGLLLWRAPLAQVSTR